MLRTVPARCKIQENGLVSAWKLTSELEMLQTISIVSYLGCLAIGFEQLSANSRQAATRWHRLTAIMNPSTCS